jgi:hypothetical protein
MSENTVIGLQKPKREGTTKVLARSLKPADLQEDGDETVAVMTFVDEQGNSKRMPCTREVYKRVEGNPRPGKPHKALDMVLDKDFVVSIRDNVVVGVDVLPKVEARRFGTPADSEGVENVTVRVNQTTGEYDVVNTPPGLTTKALMRMLTSLDKEDLIKPGTILANRYEVLSVSGNLVEIYAMQDS